MSLSEEKLSVLLMIKQTEHTLLEVLNVLRSCVNFANVIHALSYNINEVHFLN